MAVIAKPAARKPAVKKVTRPNDGDKITVTVVGAWDENDGYVDLGPNQEEVYIDLTAPSVTFEILEVAPVYEDDDVIKDANGDFFIRNMNRWQSFDGTHYITPVRPFLKATFA